jgi:SAM-dependent methyltransferase
MPAMDYARVAQYYDLYARTEIDVPFFLEEAWGCKNVLELTSGTGRLSIPLIEAGVKLSCLDSSAEMLAILREKLAVRGLSAPVYAMDMCGFALPEKFDLVLIPFNSFAEITERGDQERALAAIRKHLSEGGRFICTIHNPAVRLRSVDGHAHVRGTYALPDGTGSLTLTSREDYDAGAMMVRGEQVYEIRGVDGEVRERWSVPIAFCLHSKERFEGLGRSCGFKAESLYGDYSRKEFIEWESPFMIWVMS